MTVSLDGAGDEPWVPTEDPDWPEVYWDYWWHAPSSHPFHTCDSVYQASDVLPRYLRARMPPCECLESVDIVVPFPRQGGEHRTLMLSREPGHDFTERERLLLTLLRPHLVAMRRNIERRQAGVPKLSPRQWEVLRLAADGYTNAQIAQKLFVAESTVRKHLENIYERLGVTTRTAAVTTAFAASDPG